MIKVTLGNNALIWLQLSAGEINLFPQVLIINSAGTLLSTGNMIHDNTGFYTYIWTPPAVGQYVARYKIYTNAIHTILTTAYGIIGENINVEADLVALINAGVDLRTTGEG